MIYLRVGDVGGRRLEPQQGNASPSIGLKPGKSPSDSIQNESNETTQLL